MKIGGVDPKTLSSMEILVLPRGDDRIVFRAVGVPDYDEFNDLVKEPKAPVIMKPGMGWIPNEEEPGYKDAMKSYGMKRLSWLVVKSLEPSDIEWEKVNSEIPSTWIGWEKELRDSGFSQIECQRVQHLVFQANCLDEDKLTKARENFLLGQARAPSDISGLSIAPETTQLGKPASE